MRLPPPGQTCPERPGPAHSRALPASCERKPPMLTLPGANAMHFCDGLSRRDFLQIGGLGAVGLALPDLFRARAQGSMPPARGSGRARACILLFMAGGPPQMDTFDLK